MIRTTVALAVLALACGRASEQRALDEDLAGHANAAGLTIDVTDGLAAVRTLEPSRIVLWASAPTVELTISVPATAAGTWQLVVENALTDAVVTAPTLALAPPAPRPRPTVLVQQLELVAGEHRVVIAAPDAATAGTFRFVAMADIQTGLPDVDDVFREIATTGPRFVVFMGDLTERGELAEYDLLAEQLETLPVPFYPTLGNHELWAEPSRYRERYGRSTFRFGYRGVTFVFADSGDAGLDPLVERRVEGWLAEPDVGARVFLTHFPPIDPFGVRDGSFRSRRDAHRLLQTLAAGGVDLTLYGHVHTFLAFENAGIPAFVSGGGGAQPERWDGIGRHFLVIDVAADQKPTVGLHRVD